MKAATEAVLQIAPPPPRFISGTSYFMPRNALLQIDSQDAVEVARRVVLNRMSAASDTGVIERHVEPAGLRLDAGDQGRNVLLFRNVGPRDVRGPARLRNQVLVLNQGFNRDDPRNTRPRRAPRTPALPRGRYRTLRRSPSPALSSKSLGIRGLYEGHQVLCTATKQWPQWNPITRISPS